MTSSTTLFGDLWLLYVNFDFSRPISSTTPSASKVETSAEGKSYSLNFSDELPQLTTRVRVDRASWNYFCANCRRTTLMAMTLRISVALHPRDKSDDGLAMPCRIGPMASALPRRSVSL